MTVCLDYRAALADLPDSWDRLYGPVDPDTQAAAVAAFDELETLLGNPAPIVRRSA